MMLKRLIDTHLFRASAAALAAVASLSLQTAVAQTAPATNALPTGANVVAGSAQVVTGGTAAAPVMTVNQGSDRAIVNWNTFNVGRDASVVFQQPAPSSVILNRVLDSNPSAIFGNLQANGQVFLLNPAGVWFAPGSSVDVGALVATTHSMSNADFMAGNYRFERNGASGKVINEGSIEAKLGGYIALLAPEVRNDGVLLAKSGTIALAAGETVTLNVNPATSKVDLLVTPSTVDALIENKKIVKAPDGNVIVSAQAYNTLAAGVIKNSGEISAAGITKAGGKIVLGASTEVANTGTLDASSAVADGGSVSIEADTVKHSGLINVASTVASTVAGGTTGKGGEAILAGNYIYIEGGAKIDATGTTGGGKVLVGGDWQGSGDLRHAIRVAMDANASIDASAVWSGQGGTIVLWSAIDNPLSLTQVAGDIKANGGNFGGDGGQIETSGHLLDLSDVRGSAAAAKGAPGTWLLDPYNVEITSYDQTVSQASGTYTPTADSSKINVSTVNTLLSGGTNVTVTTGSSGSNELGDIMVNANILKSGSTNATLRLQAANSIIINGSISQATGAGITGKLNLEFDADNNLGSRDSAGISMLNNSIMTNGGYVTFGTASGGGDVYVGGGSTAVGITTSGGAVTINRQTIIANSSATGFTINSGGGDITFGGAIDSGNSYVFISPNFGSGTWLQAAQDAKNGTNGGAATGDSYLISITSKLENSIATYVAGYKGAWIGAYRDPNTSSWYWIGGPEASGTYAQYGSSPFTAVSGASSTSFFTQGSGLTASGKYQNFGSGEPNGSGGGGENVGQFFGTLGLWNDLSRTTAFGNSSGQYSVWGYVREKNELPSRMTVNAGTGNVTMSGAVGASKELDAVSVTSLGFTATAIKTISSVSVTNSGAGTISSTISGSGGLTKAGFGTLTLTGNSTYTGPTNVNSGTLKFGTNATIYCDSNCGAAPNFGDVATAITTVNSGATLDLSNWNWAGNLGERYYDSYSLVINGGTLRYSGVSGNAATATRGFTVGALGATFDSSTAGVTWGLQSSGAASYTPIFNGNVNFTGAGDIDFGHLISGNRAVTKSGTGTLILTANNTYTGTTTINAGTLQIGNGGSTGTLGTGNVTNNGSLVADRTGTYLIPNLISGTGRLTKRGAGNVSLLAANTYSGGTTLSAGTLAGYSNTSFGSGDFTAAAGTTVMFGRAVTSVGNNFTLNGNVTFDFDNYVDYLIIGGGGGGSGGIGGGGGAGEFVSGGMQLTSSSYGVTVGAGGAGGNWATGASGDASSAFGISAAGGGAGGSGWGNRGLNGGSGGGGGAMTNGAGTSVKTGGGFGFNGGNGSLDGSGGNLAVGGGGGGAGGAGGASSGQTGGAGGAGRASDITGTNVMYAGGGGGGINGQFGWSTGPAGAGQAGGGDGGAPQATASSPRNNGGNARANSGSGGGGGSNSDYGGNGGSGIVVLRYLGGTASSGGTIASGTGTATSYTVQSFTATGSNTLTMNPILVAIGGKITGSGGVIADATGGTLKFDGANTYTGTTAITGGVVQTSTTTALGNNSAVNISNVVGAQLQLLNNLTIGSLGGGGSTGGNVSLGANTLTLGGNNASTLHAGVISGTGALVKNGTGMQGLGGGQYIQRRYHRQQRHARRLSQRRLRHRQRHGFLRYQHHVRPLG